MFWVGLKPHVNPNWIIQTKVETQIKSIKKPIHETSQDLHLVKQITVASIRLEASSCLGDGRSG